MPENPCTEAVDGLRDANDADMGRVGEVCVEPDCDEVPGPAACEDVCGTFNAASCAKLTLFCCDAGDCWFWSDVVILLTELCDCLASKLDLGEKDWASAVPGLCCEETSSGRWVAKARSPELSSFCKPDFDVGVGGSALDRVSTESGVLSWVRDAAYLTGEYFGMPTLLCRGRSKFSWS